MNISTRGLVGTGNSVLIAGFIIHGTQEAPVIVRALGPSLSQYLAGSLSDPRLEVRDSNGRVVATNDNFGDASADQKQLVQNAGLAPPDPKESALAVTLAPTTYTAVVSGANTSTGIALVEVYNLR